MYVVAYTYFLFLDTINVCISICHAEQTLHNLLKRDFGGDLMHCRYFIDGNNVIHDKAIHENKYTEDFQLYGKTSLKAYLRDAPLNEHLRMCNCCAQIEPQMHELLIKRLVMYTREHLIETAVQFWGMQAYWDETYSMVHIHCGLEEWLVDYKVAFNRATLYILWHKNMFYKKGREKQKLSGYHFQWQRNASEVELLRYIKQHASKKQLV